MDCEPSCPGCVALRAKKAALEQEMEMLMIEQAALICSAEILKKTAKEYGAETLKETVDELLTSAGFLAEAEPSI